MIRWPLSRIADAVAGRPSAADPGAHAAGVSIDTRTLEPGNLFFAIRGENFDGHDFLDAAVSAGASAVVVDHADAVPDGAPAIEVADTRRALAALAAAYRVTLSATVIGVTGSAGKTTTCRLLDSVLSQSLRGTVSVKSFNNAVGVPLTILRAFADDEYLICEMGTSSPGEIAALSAMALPDIAVVTSVGRAHLELLGDVDGVRREKASIVSGLRDGGLVLMPSGDEALAEFLPAGVRVETVGFDDDASVRVEPVDLTPTGTHFQIDGADYSVPLVGDHHAVNAAFAVRVAREFGIDADVIRRGFSTVAPAAMRFETREVGGVMIVNDAYNANPESTAAALRAFAAAHAEAKRRIVILGDMLELGSHSKSAHEEIAGFVAALGFDGVVAVGPASCDALNDFAEVALESLDEYAHRVVELFDPGDAVLLKGSRGMGLERVLEAWVARCSAGAGA